MTQMKYSQTNLIPLSLDDLSNFTYFANWIGDNFDIKLKDIDPENLEFAMKELMRSKSLSDLSDQERGKFIKALNDIIPNISKIKDLKDE